MDCLYPRVQHIPGGGAIYKDPSKELSVLSPDTVLTTCNKSLQPHGGPRNLALLLPHFTELKAQGTSLFLCGGRKDTGGGGEDVASGPSVSCEIL